MARPHDAASTVEGGEGSRRRRDRRRRGDRSDRPARGASSDESVLPSDQSAMTNPSAPPRSDADVVERSQPVPETAAPPVDERVTAPAGPAASLSMAPAASFDETEPAAPKSRVSEERAEPSTSASQPAMAPHEQVLAAETPAEPRPSSRQIEPLPPISMALPADSGLELVETRSAVAPMPEAEPVPSSGPRRVRPTRVAIPDEPLQIVETRKESPPPAG